MSDNKNSLCETAQLLATTLDGASERAILLDADGHILYMNASASKFLYTSPQKHVSDFIPDITDWSSLETSRVVMKNGTTTRSKRNIHVMALNPCVCCQSKYYAMYVCSKHERVREVVDIAFDAVLTVDESGIICTVNQATLDLFDYSDETELVGKSMSIICGGGHAEHHDEYIKTYLTTGIKKMIGQKRETLGRKKDGSEFPVELGIQEITDVSSGKRYFCGFIRDLTLVKQQQAEIQERQALAQGMIDASFDSMFEIDERGKIQIGTVVCLLYCMIDCSIFYYM